MQTQTHFLITVLANRQAHSRSIPIHTSALLLGSMLPDIPFTLLTVGFGIYYRWFEPLPINAYDSVMEYLHFDMFFTDPVWIVSHNLFHSLIVNTVLIVVGLITWQLGKHWGRFILWLSISMQFHTFIDIFTHHSDGPLIFFPFNLSYRFVSPISYWESEAYGSVFMMFEYTLDLAILIYLLWLWHQFGFRSALTGET